MPTSLEGKNMKAIEPKQPKLTLKQRKFIKLYLKSGNATRACQEAYGCSLNSARRMGSENLSKLGITIKDFMEAKGLDIGQLMDVLEDGLHSWKVKTSLTEPDKKIPDFATRHKYLETMGKWLGVEATQNNSTNSQTNIQINLGLEND